MYHKIQSCAPHNLYTSRLHNGTSIFHIKGKVHTQGNLVKLRSHSSLSSTFSSTSFRYSDFYSAYSSMKIRKVLDTLYLFKKQFAEYLLCASTGITKINQISYANQGDHSLVRAKSKAN